MRRPCLAGRALCEAHELAPDPDPAVGRVGGQHPELAGVRIDPPDAHGADDLVAETGHRQLARPGERDDPVDRRPGRALGPEAALGLGVDLVRQRGDPRHQLRVVAGGGRERPDLDLGAQTFATVIVNVASNRSPAGTTGRSTPEASAFVGAVIGS